jgi:hypothetical protein
MKRVPTCEQRRQRRNAAFIAARSTPSQSAHSRNWLALLDVDGGPDAAYREMIERIARGDRIRGHAL